MLKQIVRHRVVRQSTVQMLGFFAAGLFSYFFQVAVSRKLSVESYGEFQSLLALFAVFGIFSSALSYFVITHTAVFAHAGDVAAHQQFLRWLGRFVFPATGLLLAVFLGLTPVIRGVLHLSDAGGYAVVGLSALVSLIAVLHTGALTGWQEFVTLNVVTVASSAVKLLAGLFLVSLIPRATSAAVAVLVSSVSIWLLARALGGRRIRARTVEAGWSGTDWRQRYFPKLVVWRDVGFVTLFTLLVTLLQNLDLLLVRYFSTGALTGQYSALGLTGKIVLWANLGIVTVILPAASAEASFGRSTDLRHRAAATGLIAFVSGIAIALFALFPRLILNTLFGARYEAFAGSLWIFGVIALALSLLLLEAYVALARRDARMLLLLALTTVLFGTGIAVFGDGIRNIALSVAGAVTLGYVGALILNLRRA
ncbi:MAG: hypothetical protein Q8R32_02365 [bacterium]|nr:hypothetical protein [bacterium]